jgi:hypothetical protein
VSPLKKYNTRLDSAAIQSAICGIFLDLKPRLTIKQIYYALTVKGIVPQTEAGYRQTCNQLKTMREHGIIPYDWIADNIPYTVKPITYTNLGAALDRWQLSYPRDLWANQDNHVEIWVEKNALAAVISPITMEYDVPLFVPHGYSSQSFLRDVAEGIKGIGKTPFIYYFGDYDPSGVDAVTKTEMGLWMHGVYVNFEWVAITENQIDIFHLPVCKIKASDPCSKTLGNKPSAELDALPAPILRYLVKECIERHIDPTEWERIRLIEQLEWETLATMRQNLVQVQKSLLGGMACWIR